MGTLLLIHLLPIHPFNRRQPLFHGLRIRADDAAIPSDLDLLVLNVRQWTLRGNGIFVLEDEDVAILAEQAIDVFERAVGGFGVKEVDDWDEGGVENGPDYVELPVEILDA